MTDDDKGTPINLDGLPKEVSDYIHDMRSEVKKAKAELKAATIEAERMAQVRRYEDIRTMPREQYRSELKKFLHDQRIEHALRRERVLSESMGAPIVLEEGKSAEEMPKEPVDVRILDKKTYNEMRNSFRSGLRGKR